MCGNLKQTVRIWDHILTEFPRYSTKTESQYAFFFGDIWCMRDLNRVLPNWDEG